MISFCKVDYKILPLSTNTNMYLPIILFIGLQLELSKKKKYFFFTWNENIFRIFPISQRHWHFSHVRTGDGEGKLCLTSKHRCVLRHFISPPTNLSCCGGIVVSSRCNLITIYCYFFSSHFEIWAMKQMFIALIGHQRWYRHVTLSKRG